jgi:K+-transporting ATPase ATPase A chain
MWQGFFQIALTLLILVAITPFFGRYIAHVFMGQRTLLDPVLNPVERIIFLLSGVQSKENMTGWQYARALLLSNLVMALLLAFLVFNQGWLPFNPTDLSAPTWDTNLHTIISFITRHCLIRL